MKTLKRELQAYVIPCFLAVVLAAFRRLGVGMRNGSITFRGESFGRDQVFYPASGTVVPWPVRAAVGTLQYAARAAQVKAEARHFCQCCGRRSLITAGEYDVCVLCGWEDEPLWASDMESGPNHMTLSQGREIYKLLGVHSPGNAAFTIPRAFHRGFDYQRRPVARIMERTGVKMALEEEWGFEGETEEQLRLLDSWGQWSGKRLLRFLRALGTRAAEAELETKEVL